MINAISIALSGLNAATTKLNTSASNIANLQSEGSDDVSETNLTEDLVNMKIAKTEYKANIATLKTAEEMSDELLRLFDEKV